MYQEFFKLTERPFAAAPYAPHYFPSRHCEQALQLCRMAIDEATGPALLMGGPGFGKSMMLAVMAEQYRHHYVIANLHTSSLKCPADLLQNILFELDRPYRNMLEGDMRLALMEHLKPVDKCPNGILLLADEADCLDETVLNELRSITNYVRDGLPRVRLVLAGNARLEETLTSPRLDSFSQRIAARCYLQPMLKQEIVAYVDQHLRRAGRVTTDMFESLAIDGICEVSQGIPRLINQLCCHSMILAATDGAAQVTRDHVATAWTDIQQLPAPWGNEKSASQDQKPLEDWAVIEFGQLDDHEQETPAWSDTSPAEDSKPLAEQPQQASPVETVQETPVSPVISETDCPSSADECNDFSTSVFSTNPFTEGFTIETETPEHLPVNPLPAAPPASPDQHASLFGVGFTEEEEVKDEFLTWSAEQNRTSLNVTDNELDSLLAQADSIQHQIGAASPESVGPEVILNDSQPTTSDLIQADADDEIRQLYDIYDNQQQLAEQIAVASQPVDPREHQPRAEPEQSLPAIEYPITEHNRFADHRSDSPPTVARDDRDMLMVSHQDNLPGQPLAPSDETPVGETMSTGQAIRMNYQTLFQQLRGGDEVTSS